MAVFFGNCIQAGKLVNNKNLKYLLFLFRGHNYWDMRGIFEKSNSDIITIQKCVNEMVKSDKMVKNLKF